MGREEHYQQQLARRTQRTSWLPSKSRQGAPEQQGSYPSHTRLNSPRTLLAAFFLALIGWLVTTVYLWNTCTSAGLQLPDSPVATAIQHSQTTQAANATNWTGLPSLGLHRKNDVIRLETALDNDVNVGICTLGLSALPGFPESRCPKVHCYWSPNLQANVDFFYNALQPMQPELTQDPCPTPYGGQTSQTTGTALTLAIIITAHNKPRMAAQALLEAFRAVGEVESAEIIVVDDGSTEDMGVLREACRRLTAFFGTRVQYLVNKKALGFGAANMRGVHASRAEYVMLLNSDAFLMKGAVYALLRTMREVPDAGIVGPLFIGADFKVSEGGGVVFRDGEAAIYGRGGVVAHEVNFRRPVDYISAACIVFKRQVFLEVGGFDPLYGEGYFEDTDLAMAMRRHGLQVVHQPLAVVLHQEGSTLGTDESPRKQELMEENTAKFARKWRKQLQQQHCPRQAEFSAVARHWMAPKVLWVEWLAPETDRDSGSIRMWNILQILIKHGYDVSFQPTARGTSPLYIPQARFAGVDVLPVKTSTKQWDVQADNLCGYDAIVVGRRLVFSTLEEVFTATLMACPGLKLIFDTVDLHFLREARVKLTNKTATAVPAAVVSEALPEWDFQAVSTSAVLDWLDSEDPEAADEQDYRDQELGLVDMCAATIVVSSVEREILQHYRPKAKIHTISNIHKIEPRATAAPYAPCSDRRGVLFVGGLHHKPNLQAVEELLQYIVPSTLRQLPDSFRDGFDLHIVGSNRPDEMQWLRELTKQVPNVILHRYLSADQLRMLYSTVRVVVAPLLSGAGVKGKVNEAMKYGVPVVATPIAVEAMHVRPGQDCLVAGSREEFARKLVEVYSDCALWGLLVEGGHENVRRYFSVESAEEGVLRVFRDVGAGPLRSADGRGARGCGRGAAHGV